MMGGERSIMLRSLLNSSPGKPASVYLV